VATIFSPQNWGGCNWGTGPKRFCDGSYADQWRRAMRQRGLRGRSGHYCSAQIRHRLIELFLTRDLMSLGGVRWAKGTTRHAGWSGAFESEPGPLRI